jgi:hypothetical protein
MATDRKPRDEESRDLEQRNEYQPSSALPDPKQDPHFVYRWVATHVMGLLDPMNASKRFRDGWEPVKAVDHPELHTPGNKDGNVEIGGLMLCRMPPATGTTNSRATHRWFLWTTISCATVTPACRYSPNASRTRHGVRDLAKALLDRRFLWHQRLLPTGYVP